MTNTRGVTPAGRRASLIVRMSNAAREAGVVPRRVHLVVAIDRLSGSAPPTRLTTPCWSASWRRSRPSPFGRSSRREARPFGRATRQRPRRAVRAPRPGAAPSRRRRDPRRPRNGPRRPGRRPPARLSADRSRPAGHCRPGRMARCGAAAIADELSRRDRLGGREGATRPGVRGVGAAARGGVRGGASGRAGAECARVRGRAWRVDKGRRAATGARVGDQGARMTSGLRMRPYEPVTWPFVNLFPLHSRWRLARRLGGIRRSDCGTHRIRHPH